MASRSMARGRRRAGPGATASSAADAESDDVFMALVGGIPHRDRNARTSRKIPARVA